MNCVADFPENSSPALNEFNRQRQRIMAMGSTTGSDTGSRDMGTGGTDTGMGGGRDFGGQGMGDGGFGGGAGGGFDQRVSGDFGGGMGPRRDAMDPRGSEFRDPRMVADSGAGGVCGGFVRPIGYCSMVPFPRCPMGQR